MQHQLPPLVPVAASGEAEAAQPVTNNTVLRACPATLFSTQGFSQGAHEHREAKGEQQAHAVVCSGRVPGRQIRRGMLRRQHVSGRAVVQQQHLHLYQARESCPASCNLSSQLHPRCSHSGRRQ